MEETFRWATVQTCEELRGRMPEFLESPVPVLVVNQGNWGSVEAFALAVREARAATFDFDGTLTPGSQWAAMCEHCMTPELAEQDRVESRAYFARTGERSVEKDIAFIFGSIGRMMASKASWTCFERAAKALAFRPGAIDLLKSFRARDQPVAVVSFGVRTVIRIALETHGTGAGVLALALSFDKFDLVGCQPETVVTDANKQYIATAFRVNAGVRAEQVLATGDSFTDIGLMDPRGPGVLIIPKHDPHTERASDRMRHLEPLFSRVGAFLVGDTLEPLAFMRHNTP